MKTKSKVLLVNDIKLSVNASTEEAFSLAKKRLDKINLNTSDISFSIYKKSVDARKKDDIKFVYTVRADGEFGNISQNRLLQNSISLLTDTPSLNISYGKEQMNAPPLVVGSGPCGLFAALILAENGYNPIIIERGGSIQERKKLVKTFHTENSLDLDTNIQFGAGGAGTFSDGKLVTRVNDPLASYVFQKFVEFGAPKEILYLAKPHVGTDILSEIVEKILSKIASLGGTVMYHTKLISIKKQLGKSVAVTNRGNIIFSSLILATGHSARDTYSEIINDGFAVEAKPFSVGMRIEHLANDIDRSMYGDFAGHPNLGHAEYNLSYNTKERGVYTFCMCPGGEVVAATSEEFGTVVNGMSYHKRDGKNSNSAVVCSIFPSDYGATPNSAIEFQRRIEHAAFIAGGSNYSAPIITVGDFISGKCEKEPSLVLPTYMNAKHVKLASPSKYLPKIVCDSISNALFDFNKKIDCFASESAILTGAETRTSAPIRILRDPTNRLAIGQDNIYPAGEGAGYAGGITSAAIDGIKTALTIINKFTPNNHG